MTISDKDLKTLADNALISVEEAGPDYSWGPFRGGDVLALVQRLHGTEAEVVALEFSERQLKFELRKANEKIALLEADQKAWLAFLEESGVKRAFAFFTAQVSKPSADKKDGGAE